MNDDEVAHGNLTYTIKDIEGVEVDILCNSLRAISDEYQRFTNSSKRLVVKEVRKGSGVFEFIEQIIIPTLAFIGETNTVFEFAKHIKTTIDKISGNLPDSSKLTKETVKNVNYIFAPVINGNNNYTSFSMGEQPIVSMGQEEYGEIKTRSKEVIKSLQTDNVNFIKDECHSKVLFQWVQTNFDSPKVGNKGVIQKIQKKPVKVIFADDNASYRTEMMTSKSGIDWQKIIYTVDVETMTNDSQIIGYKILKNYPDDCIVPNEPDLELFS